MNSKPALAKDLPMIQPAAPASFPALSVLGDGLTQPTSEAADGAGFGALLALQSVASAPEGAESVLQPSAATLAGSVTIEPAKTGKFLPLDLPETTQAQPRTELPTAMPLAAAVAVAIRPANFAAKLEKSPKPEKNPKPETLPETDTPQVAAAAASEPEPMPPLPILIAFPPAEAEAAATALPSTEVPILSAAPAAHGPEDKAKPERDHAGQGPVQRTIPTLPATASSQAQAQMQRHADQAPAAAIETALPATHPAQQNPQPAAVPAEQVRVELALPRLVQAKPLVRDEPGPLAKLVEPALLKSTMSELVLPDTASPLTSSLTQPQPVTGQVAAPVGPVRPHDFAALIERIAVAREAAAPQAVSITVTHQDFGQVRLSFRPEDTGLSVAMSSADPGFARAAAAVPAPALPSTVSDQTGPGQNQRSDSGAAQTGGQSHSRGGSGDPRRDSQPHSQANPGPRTGRDRSAPRTGIFA